MSNLITIVLPLLFIVMTGFAAGHGKFLDIQAARALSRYVFLFAMPVAIIGFYTRTDPPGAELIPYFAGYFLAMIIIIALAVWSGQKLLRLSVQDSGAHAFVSTCGNAVFLGLPIALQIEGWGQPFLMLMILEGTFVFGITTALMTWDTDPAHSGGPVRQLASGIARSATKPFQNPIVVASLVGIVIAFLDINFPAPVMTFLDLFGRTAGPTGLFVLGLYIATLPHGEFRNFLPNILNISIIKLILFPVLAGGLVYVFTGGDMVLTGTVVLFTGMPPAVASIVQASHYNLYEKETAASVSAASVSGLIVLAIILVLFA